MVNVMVRDPMRMIGEIVVVERATEQEVDSLEGWAISALDVPG